MCSKPDQDNHIKNENFLFLLAAVSGAGKSTLLKHHFNDVGNIFNREIKKYFLETNLDKNRDEYFDFDMAYYKKSFFKAVHIPKLRNLNNFDRSILIHLDIYNILKDLSINSDYLTRRQNKNLDLINGLGNNIRSDSELINAEENNFLMQNYLSDIFFKKWRGIVVINLYCDYYRVQQQLKKRNGGFGFGHPSPIGEEIYNQIYSCWKINSTWLNPILNIEILFMKDGYRVILPQGQIIRS